ncbi:MAG TPA: hypothetical protein VFW11_05090, partial [Cyclobacteriaceae bacterium]|nr:hypothetical protein [Cyclobacteriaceae bacterium]
KAAFKQSLNKARFISQLFVWFLIFGVCLFAISFLHPNFRLSYLPEVIVKNNEAYTRLSSPDNLILFKNLEPDFFSMARHSPQALLSGIFRPGIWEASSVLKFLSAMENLFLAILIALTLMRRKAISRQNRLLTFAVLIYIVLLCVLLTLATPNLGTLVRYRVGFIPFLVYLLLHGSNITKSLERLFVRLVRHK